MKPYAQYSEHQFGSFRLDPVNQCLWQDAQQIPLSPKAYAVLLYLVERAGRLVTKQELLDAVWPDIHVTEGVLKRAVLEIRKALADPVEEPRFIQTMHRRGYRFLCASNQTAASEQLPSEATNVDRTGMVGRVAESQKLDSWLEAALASSRQVVFITGEAGLGKTTLVENWMRSLDERGLAVAARGHCLPHLSSGEPYLPVFEALDQLSQELGRRLLDVLRACAPTWLLQMPGLMSPEDRAKLRDEVFGSTPERMLRELTDALELLSRETPIVLVLEDLHWSDPSTIDLLSSIARRTAPARLMILATFRPAESLAATSSLLAVKNELEIHKQCKVLPLTYLSESETGEYLATRFPDTTAPALAAALHCRTNGNPLCLVCLVDELTSSGAVNDDRAAICETVPAPLLFMFARQAAELDRAEQQLLGAAAVAGESFSIAAVAKALGWEEADAESLCDSLAKRQLILKRSGVTGSFGRSQSAGYSFIHGLSRDSIYRSIPRGQRSQLHRALNQAGEQLNTPAQKFMPYLVSKAAACSEQRVA